MTGSLSLNRRHALLGLGLASSVTSGCTQAQSRESEQFLHGVASGDPLNDRVVIWTRVSKLDKMTSVAWEVALDQSFAAPVAQGSFDTDAASDYTVKIDVTGLKAGTDYFYRFKCAGAVSPVGRTRTLPENTSRVVMAVASCSLYTNGYFNAYRAIADLAEVDVIVHLGDYIYEYGAAEDDYGMKNGLKLGRIPEPKKEIVSLSDYRTRHAQYKTDADLQAAHARAPFICVFDDHEMTNDPWMGDAQNHNPDKGEGDFFERKAAALKAYREWMPIRDVAAGELSEAIYRSFRFGSLCELFMTETRFLARSKQLNYRKDIPVKTDEKGKKVPDYQGFVDKLNDPSRELLGQKQRAWLGSGLTSSVADGVKWQILGNQVVMAKVKGPNLPKIYGKGLVNTLLFTLPAKVKAIVEPLVVLFSQDVDLPLNLDAWDGYPAERERVFDLIKAAKARTIVLSGDSHQAWGNELKDKSGQLVAVEMGVTAISSPTIWFDGVPGFNLAKVLADQNEEVLAASTDRNGFVRLTLTPEKMTGEWVSVSTITEKEFKVTTDATFEAQALEGAVGPLKQII